LQEPIALNPLATRAKAVQEYVQKRQRAKDGLALKAQTQADCLAMLEPGKVSKKGKKFANGELYSIADKLLASITADDIHAVFAAQLRRSARQAVHAIQVLRAVPRWQGVAVEGNPLSRETAGRDRIVLAPPRGIPAPIPPDRLGAWRRAAGEAPSTVAGDHYRLQLPTGCRGGEIHGNKRHGYEPIKARHRVHRQGQGAK
jgi:hypothetical protein